MRFLFLNQYGPPDPVPTARLLGELANHLQGQGHEVEILSQSQSYHGRPARGGSRWRRELTALFAIGRAGWSGKRARPDVVLSLTSPPGLVVVAALLARRHRARLAHWAMDLYPELALALGETGPNAIFHGIQNAMRWAYRRCALVIALDEDMQSHLQTTYGLKDVRVLEPWSSAESERQIAAASASAPEAETPWIWLYSGNLGRAHEWRTLLDAQRLLELRGGAARLVFQGDGAARPLAIAYAESIGLQRCAWNGYVHEAGLIESLLGAQALVATQRPETRGLLWPSKLALLERLPRPVLYVGPVDGAIANRLRRRAGTGIFAPGQAEEVAAWIESCQHGVIAGAAAGNQVVPNALIRKCRQLEVWLSECTPRKS